MSGWWRPGWQRMAERWKRGVPSMDIAPPLPGQRRAAAEKLAANLPTNPGGVVVTNGQRQWGLAVPLYSFATAEEVDAWHVFSDEAYGGRSRGSFELTPEGNARFSGSLSLATEGTKMSQSGFVALMRKKRSKVTGLPECDALEFRVKTDGRVYIVNIKAETVVKDHLYQAVFSTPKGEWADILLPFDNFTLTWRGQVEGEHVPIDPDFFQAVGFLMAERKEGDFEMELAWVRAVSLASQFGKERRYSGRHADYIPLRED